MCVELRRIFLSVGISLFFIPGLVQANTSKLDRLADHIVEVIQDKCEAALVPLKSAPQSCLDLQQVNEYLESLIATGAHESCAQLARKCTGELKAGTKELGHTYFLGAACLRAGSDVENYENFLAESIRSIYSSDPRFDSRVFTAAVRAMTGDQAGKIRAILSKSPSWSDQDARSYEELIYYLYADSAAPAERKRLEALTRRLIRKSDAFIKPILVNALATRLITDERATEALELLKEHSAALGHPSNWISTAFDGFYYQRRQNTRRARGIYDAFLPFSNPTSWAPIMANVYNYTQLYETVCRDHLLQGKEFDRYEGLKAQWLSGKVSASEVVEKALSLNELNPGKADLLTLLGGAYESLGKLDAAAQLYSNAQQACPYYNRASEGLIDVHARRLFERLPRHEEFARRAVNLAEDTRYPKILSKYVENWDMLEPDAKLYFKYGARFWARTLNVLYEGGGRLYVKMGFQFLSEVPGLEDVRDRRVPHEFDHRLHDDVGGIYSGESKRAVVAYSSIMRAPFFNENVVAHEMAHQFHSMLPQLQGTCLEMLYEEAKAENRLADSYSGVNSHEYFARGVELYLTDPDGPGGARLNRTWLKKNDPPLFRFIESIETASTMADIRCQ